MLRIDDLQLFVRTADSGSLHAAARGPDVSPAVASAALKRLEASLCAAVRALHPQPASDCRGRGLSATCPAALASLDEGHRRSLVVARRSVVCCSCRRRPTSGATCCCRGSTNSRRVIRSCGAPAAGRRADRSVPSAGGHRPALWRAGGFSLVALPVAGEPRVLCASPAYLQRYGEPDGWTSWRRTTACASCSPGACMTAEAFRKDAGAHRAGQR